VRTSSTLRAPLRALLVLWAASAWAQDEPPFRRLQVPGQDVCIAWAERSYTYTPDAAGSARTPDDTEFAAIDRSFQTWQAASDTCSDFQFLRGERMPNTVFGYDRSSPINNNIVVFRETACRDVVPAEDPCRDDGSCSNAYRCWDHGDFTIGLTVTFFTARSGLILDADVAFNASLHLDGERFLFTTVSSPPCEEGAAGVECVATDVENTLTHELGHAVGLDHVLIPGSTMEPTAPLGETLKRRLDSGTRGGFCQIYPRGLPAADCFQTGQISPHVEAVNRGTPGLPTFACSTSAGGPLLGAVLVLLARWLAHRGITAGRARV